MLPEVATTARNLFRALTSFRHLRAQAPTARRAGPAIQLTLAERRQMGLRLLRAVCEATGHGLRDHVGLDEAGRAAGLGAREAALACDYLLDRDLVVGTDPDGEHLRITEEGITALEDAGIEVRRREPETEPTFAFGASQRG